MFEKTCSIGYCILFLICFSQIVSSQSTEGETHKTIARKGAPQTIDDTSAEPKIPTKSTETKTPSDDKNATLHDVSISPTKGENKTAEAVTPLIPSTNNDRKDTSIKKETELPAKPQTALNETNHLDGSTTNSVSTIDKNTTMHTTVNNATVSTGGTNSSTTKQQSSTNATIPTSSSTIAPVTKPATTVKATTTTTTTVAPPKKPTITQSVESDPSLRVVENKGPIGTPKIAQEPEVTHAAASGKLTVDEIEPELQYSKEDLTPQRTDYIVPITAMIFIVPIILGALVIGFRHFRDFWNTRHYRRMDFLLDGMYND